MCRLVACSLLLSLLQDSDQHSSLQAVIIIKKQNCLHQFGTANNDWLPQRSSATLSLTAHQLFVEHVTVATGFHL